MITGASLSKFVGQIVVTAQGEECFYCHHKLADPAIAWWGAGGITIFLHPQCVVELAIRLFRDVHELECRTHSRLSFVRDAQ